MDLSIVILNYNAKDFLLPCIKGIYSHTADLDYEIIIVDNHSTDDSALYVEQNIIPRFQEVRLIRAEHNNGYAAGNNIGITHARGKYVVIMNPDIVIWENSLKRMVDFMEKHPRVGIAGPRLLSPDGSLQYFCYQFPTPQVLFYRRTPLLKSPFGKKSVREYLMMDWDHRNNRPVDWVQGSCMIARTEAINAVGPMDERYFLFLEDTDWCRRFWDHGFEVWYLADVEIIHYHSRASDAGRFYKSLFNRMAWIHVMSAIKYFKKWGTQAAHPAQTKTS